MRLLLLIGDVVVNLACGALIGGLAAVVFGPAWPGPLAMLAGMAGGMALAVPAASVAGIRLGAFEVMLPMMLGGMLAGMIVAMQASASALPAAVGARNGALIAAAALVFTWLANLALRGEDRRWRA